MLYRILTYIRFRFQALKYWHGRDVHSPFIFDLVEYVFQVPHAYYVYKRIEGRRAQLIRGREKIHVRDFGTGHDRTARVSDLVLQSAESSDVAQCLHRLCHYWRPEVILELGTQVGLTTSYLAAAAPHAQVHTIEGAPEVATIAQKTFSLIPVTNVKLHCGNIDKLLPTLLDELQKVDFVFMDANHTGEATKRYFDLLLPHLHAHSIVVIDDIRWSRDMGTAWNVIRHRKEVMASIDCYHFGLLLFEPHLAHQHYVFSIK